MPSPQKKREQLKMQRQQQEQEKLKQWREDYDRLQQAEKEGKKIYKAAGGRVRATSEEELKQKTSKAAKSAVDAELTMVKLRSQEAVKKLKRRISDNILRFNLFLIGKNFFRIILGSIKLLRSLH
jgi:hypothetical protein